MQANVTVGTVAFHEQMHSKMPKDTAEQIDVKARLKTSKWSEVDIACRERDEAGKPAAEPEPDELRKDKDRPGKIVTLDSVDVDCDFDVFVDRDVFPLGDKSGEIYLYTTTDSKGKAQYKFSLTKPSEDAPEEFNHDDMQKHVEVHADKVVEILAAYLRGYAIQKEFCGDAMKDINQWKKKQENDLQQKLFKKFSDNALAAAGGEPEEQRIRKTQYDALHSGKGHGK